MVFTFFKKLKVSEDDLRFFMVLGFLSGLALEITSFLPNTVNRGLFSDILNDHIPLTTIGIILLIQIFILLFFHSLKEGRNLKKYLKEMNYHVEKKIIHFCSPAFSLMLGLSLTCTFLATLTLNEEYLQHSFVFGAFSTIFIILPFFSSQILKSLNSEVSKTSSEVMKLIGACLFLSLLIVPFLNNNPIEITFKTSVDQYKLIEKSAEIRKEEIDLFVLKSTLKEAVQVNANK